ncbi:MAG: hypothetical protein MR425_10640 [Lachnospiraceae bacterium]|nr:hypothetical protein [Lachnospiraceae bacterium]
MDKYEYKLKLDEIKSLAGEKRYEEAAQLVDSINWRKVRNVNSLVMAGEIYAQVGRYEDGKEILLMAYDRSPIGRMIIYRLAEIAIKTKNFEEAQEYYDEFVEIAPHDNLKYVLRYEMNKEQGAGYDVLIGILEELKEQEYSEKWAFELAYLYHQAGDAEACVNACDELILWFGDGPYVEKALELKMLYQPLNKVQEDKYRAFKQRRDGVVEVRPTDTLESGEIVKETVQIPQVTTNASKFNTVNLQQELAKSMQQIMDATEKETVNDQMDNIKKIVEEIPYLAMPTEEKTEENLEEKYGHIETDEEIDGSLKINFQELLAEDRDGQISMMVPERALEKQITGQMNIEDILEEWERTRRAAEAALEEAKQRKLESAKAKALAQAEDIMDRLASVIPQLDAGMTPKDLLDQEYLGKAAAMDSKEIANMMTQNRPKEEAGQLMSDMNDILQQQIDEISHVNEGIDEFLAGERQEKLEKQEKQETDPILLAATQRIPDLPVEDMPIKDWQTEALEMGTPANAETQAEAPVIEDTEIREQESDDSNESVREESGYEAEKLMENEEATESLSPEDEDEPFSGLDFTGVIELPDEVKEEVRQTGKATIKSDVKTEEPLPEIKPVTLDEPETIHDTPVTQLSARQKEIFSYFTPVMGMEEQLCQALTGVEKHLRHPQNASAGNLIIQGDRGNGKTVLATSFLKALQEDLGRSAAKVGRIDATSLNGKDIPGVFRKIKGGCLIIEKAGALSRETAVRLSLAMETQTEGIFVILEDTRTGIKKALGRDESFARKFTEKITIPVFTSDELVAFAKSYAKELYYEIDNMAVLALYNRISNIQRLDQATTLTEVKEIVDEAIASAEKFSMKKIFSARKRRNSEYEVLQEKDFEE